MLFLVFFFFSPSFNQVTVIHPHCSGTVLGGQTALRHDVDKIGLLRNLVERKRKVKVTQSCLTLCDPMDYTVHGILQARILERVAFHFSRGSSQPRYGNQVSCITGRFLNNLVEILFKYFCGKKDVV